MIFGVGTDIIEVERMARLLEKGREYLLSIFTTSEIEYCEGRGKKPEHYAARFAAKEAVLKAMGTGWRNGLGFNEIEVANDELGKPFIQVSGKVRDWFEQKQIKQISLSLSHIKEIAIAVVILEC